MNNVKTVSRTERINCFLPYLNKRKGSLFLLVLLKLIAALLTIVHPLLFSWIINDLLSTEIKMMWRYLSLFLLLQALIMLINFFIRAIDLRIAKAINLEVKTSISKYLFELPAAQANFNKGKMYSLLVSDSSSVYTFYSTLMSLLFTVLTVVGVGVVAVSIHWKLSLLLLIPYPVELIINRCFREKIKRQSKKLLEQNDLFVSKVNNSLNNLPDAQRNGFSTVLQKSLYREADTGRLLSVQQGDTHNFFQSFVQGSGLLGYATLLTYGLFLIVNDTLSLGTFVAFHTYSKSLSASIDSLINFKTNLQPLVVSLDRIASIYKQYCLFSKEEEKKQALEETVREISVKNLSFAYGDIPVINDVSATFKRGTIYGLTGPNGNGKTTFLRLISGQLKATSGSILLNSHLIDKLKHSSVLAHIAYVDSDKHLYHLSLRQNIIPVLDAEFSADVNEFPFLKLSAVAAQCSSGFETIMGDSLNLSSGQIQRIQIARALFRDCDVLILDEAANNLDYEIKCELKEALKALSKDKIIILVSHVAEELAICDEIFEL